MLSKHLLSKLVYNQLSCDRIHLLSILTFAIRPSAINTFAINNLAINKHLLSKCRLARNPYYYQFLFLKIQKNEKNPQIWNSSFSGKLCVCMESVSFVASSKGSNLLKESNSPLHVFPLHRQAKQYIGHLWIESGSCSTNGIQSYSRN